MSYKCPKCGSIKMKMFRHMGTSITCFDCDFVLKKEGLGMPMEEYVPKIIELSNMRELQDYCNGLDKSYWSSYITVDKDPFGSSIDIIEWAEKPYWGKDNGNECFVDNGPRYEILENNIGSMIDFDCDFSECLFEV